MRKSSFIFIFCTFLYSDNDLIFLPDSGIRVDSCGISKVLVDPNGVYILYYTQGPNNGVAVSNDGLNFTIEDPQTFSRPWTGEVAMSRKPAGEVIYEYACHEGNYAFSGIMGGARRLEIDAASN